MLNVILNSVATILVVVFIAGCNQQPNSEQGEKHQNPSAIATGLLPAQRADTIRQHIEKQAKAIEATFPQTEFPDHFINLIEFSGHKPDRKGTHDFCADINNAIKTLADSGGGTLLIPHSNGQWEWSKLTDRYRIKGPIHLESNIKIVLDHGIELFFEFAPNSYLPNGKAVLQRNEGTMIKTYSPLIYAVNKQNITITTRESFGNMPIISGSGQDWVAFEKQGDAKRVAQGLPLSKYPLRDINHNQTPIADRTLTAAENMYLRPCLFEFLFCKNIILNDLHLNDSPFWTVHPVFSENLWFSGLFFTAPNQNNDGFDPESSQNIIIENCIFNNHDDNLAVKSGRDTEGRKGIDLSNTPYAKIESPYNHKGKWYGPTKNVVMRRCTFKGHHAVAIGSEVAGGADGIYVYDNVAPQELHHVVYLKSSRRRGGYIKNVYVDNIQIGHCRKMVGLVPNYDGDTTSPFVPQFSDVYVQNITAQQARHAIVATAWPEKPIENLWVYNLSVDSLSRKPYEFANVINAELRQIKMPGQVLDTLIQKSLSNKKPKKDT